MFRDQGSLWLVVKFVPIKFFACLQHFIMLADSVVVGKKSRRCRKLQFFDSHYKFLMLKIMGAQNFNFVSNFFQNGGF